MTKSTTHNNNQDSRPTVLHVRVMAGTGGGPEKTILRSPKYSDKSKYRMAVAYIHPKNDKGIETLQKQAKDLSCPLFSIPDKGPLDPSPLFHLTKLCKRLNIKIYHGHDYKSNFLGLLINKRHPMKLVNTAHLWTDDNWRMKLYRKIDERCIPRYDHTITVSTPLAERCREIGTPSDKITMVPNAIEADIFKRTRDTTTAKTSLNIDPETFTIGLTGRFTKQKGIDLLLPAIKELAGQYKKPLRLLLIGDGPEKQALSKLSCKLSLEDVVRFCGWQPDIRPWYEAMDMFILSSRDEGLPNVVLESMAMSVPTVATNVGGVADLIEHDNTGIILDNDHSNWAKQILPLLQDAALRQQFATNARQRIEEKYTFEHRMKHIISIYDNLLTCPEQHDSPQLQSAA